MIHGDLWLWVGDNLLLDHEGLSCILDCSRTWDTSPTLKGIWGLHLIHLLPLRPSKSYRWGGVVAQVILVSAPVPFGPFALGLLWVWDRV